MQQGGKGRTLGAAMLLVVCLVGYSGLVQADDQGLTTAAGWFDQGMQYAGEKHFNQAFAAFSRAVELNPRFVEAYANRGIAAERLGRTKQAVDDYTRAIDIDRKYARAYNNRGMIHLREKRYLDAIDDLSKAVALDDRSAVYRSNRAAAYARNKDHDKAIADYTAAILINPKDGDAFAGRGAAYFARGEKSRAERDLKMACSQGSDAGCRSLKAITGGS